MPTTIVKTFPQRVQLELYRGDLSVFVPMTVANGFACNQGDVLGIITASGKARRRSRTLATGTAFSNASPNAQVVDASVFAVGDVLTDDAGNTVGTVQAINTVANPNTVTLTANSAHNVAAGVGVIATDGSAVAQAIADEFSDGSSDTVMAAAVAGFLNAAILRGLDSLAITQLGGALLVGGALFKF